MSIGFIFSEVYEELHYSASARLNQILDVQNPARPFRGIKRSHDVSPGFSLGVGTCSCGHEAGQTHRERKYGRPPAGQAAAIPALAQRYSLLPPHTQHLALSAKSVVGYLYARVAALE